MYREDDDDSSPFDALSFSERYGDQLYSQHDDQPLLSRGIKIPSSFDHLLFCGQPDCDLCSRDTSDTAPDAVFDDTKDTMSERVIDIQRVGLSYHRRREALSNQSSDIPTAMSGQFLRQMLTKERSEVRRLRIKTKASKPKIPTDDSTPSWKHKTRVARQYLANPPRFALPLHS